MYHGDRSRKEVLVEFGFRLPSALDNRPLNFEEWEARVGQLVYVSATPGPYELAPGGRRHRRADHPADGARRSGRSTSGRSEDRSTTCWRRFAPSPPRGERVLVTTLTKRMAEDLAQYYQELGVRVRYLHSDIDTLERVQILRDLRLRRLRRARRHQPAAGGARSARGVARRDPRRRQGGVPAVGRRAHPDDGPRRAQRPRPRDSLRRRDDRLDAAGDRRDRPPPAGPGGLQRRARHHAGVDRQEHRRRAVERVRARLRDRAEGRRRARAVQDAGRARRVRSPRSSARCGRRRPISSSSAPRRFAIGCGAPQSRPGDARRSAGA